MKTSISIKAIGKIRFWLGVALGLSTACVLGLYLVLGRRLWFDYFSIFNKMPDSVAFTHSYYEMWMICLGVSLGVSYMIKFWSEGLMWYPIKRRRLAMISFTVNAIQFWIVLLLILRVGLVLFLTYMHTPWPVSDPISLWNDYHWMLNLIPVVIFLNSWLGLSLMFRCGRWMAFSGGICVLCIGLVKVLIDIMG